MRNIFISCRGKILTLYLRVLSLFILVLWGLTHIFFPKWYLENIAHKDASVLTPDLVLSANEIGVFAVALSAVLFAVSRNPRRHFPVILIFCLNALGSAAVTAFHILVRNASGEWMHIFIVILLLLPLAFLYPWKSAVSSMRSVR